MEIQTLACTTHNPLTPTRKEKKYKSQIAIRNIAQTRDRTLNFGQPLTAAGLELGLLQLRRRAVPLRRAT
jgi:hypothetical protein